ncbi:hypothetical protein MKY34_02125 [Sporosarcina sp. FSL K6-1522]|uniref:hypothetical protein n=1 Tax=Sporosarcina sp. FSL K6-1522 TaxID=2921554 RepID=UPI00315A090E
MHKKWIIFVCNCVLIILLFFTLNEGVGLTKWINAMFYITILNMVLFLYLFIVKGKFFDGIMHSFQQILGQQYASNRRLPSETVNIFTYEIIKFNFFALAGALFVIHIVYFVG